MEEKMGDKTAADVLKEARDLIAKDGGWTQRQYARGADDAPERRHSVGRYCADMGHMGRC